MFKNKGCSIGFFLLVVIVVLLFVGVDLYTDLAWFESLGFASIMWKRIGTEWLLFLLAWVVAAVVLVANWWLARWLAGGGQMTVPWLKPQPGRYRGTMTIEPDTRTVGARVANAFLGIVALGVSFFLGLSTRAMWLTALLSARGLPFGQTDPLLDRDLSFYLFRLPWLRFLQGWFLGLILCALAGAATV